MPDLSGWQIRQATPDDVAAVSDVLLAAALDAWATFLGAERIEAANRGRQHSANLVAEDDLGVFSFVAWDTTTGEILRLYTHPRRTGSGAGRALLDRALDAVRAAGYAQAWLNTEARNERARRFYERHGWREDGPARVREWHGARLVEPRYVKAVLPRT